jgi:hypothetical protein
MLLFNKSLKLIRVARLWRPWLDSRRGKDFSVLYSIQTGSGVHPTSYKMGTWGSFPAREADQSPPTNTEVKNGGNIPPLPHMPLRGDA